MSDPQDLEKLDEAAKTEPPAVEYEDHEETLENYYEQINEVVGPLDHLYEDDHWSS